MNLADLERFDNGTTVDAAALIEKPASSPTSSSRSRSSATATLTKKLTIVAGWYSKSAHEKITKAGGTAQNLKGEAFEFPKPKKKFVPREDRPRRRPAAGAPAEEGSRRCRGRRAAEPKPPRRPKAASLRSPR